MKFSTKAIHTGNEPNLKEGRSGDVVVPIHLSTTFARKKIDQPTAGYEYSRSGNPTRSALEKNIASLENGKYGFAFSSGPAALGHTLLRSNQAAQLHRINVVHLGTRRLFSR